MAIAIVVHGGAGRLTPEREELVQQGCKEAALVGWKVLQEGGSALDAVEAAVRTLEDNPSYNAGTGACLTIDGAIEMDAGIMEGHTLEVGSVANVELIKNPITLARRVLESPHVLLVNQGAQDFAIEQGMSLCKREDLLTERQYERWVRAREEVLTPGDAEEEPRYLRREVGFVRSRESAHGHGHKHDDQKLPQAEEPQEKHGTVGAVAVDEQGHLAAATSTGGFTNKRAGRVGDSPLVGCGFYADENAAISSTGDGEDFVRLLLAKRAADFVAQGATAREAAESAIALLGAKTTGEGGMIVVDRLGNVGFSWNSEHMVYAYMTPQLQEPVAGI